MQRKKYYFLLILFVISMFISGCSCGSNKRYVTPDLKGSKEQQIAFHNFQIKKYKMEISREKSQIRQFLSENKMSEARASFNRKDQYTKKIYYHVNEIQELERRSCRK